MKKLVALAMIVSLGLFCAVGCNKPKEVKKDAGKPAVTEPAKDGEKPAAPAEKPADKPAEKPAETK